MDLIKKINFRPFVAIGIWAIGIVIVYLIWLIKDSVPGLEI